MTDVVPRLLVRADASSRIGWGHFMRCFALAQAWTETGGQTIFAMTESSPATEGYCQMIRATHETLSSTCGSVEEAHETAALAEKHGARWIVADSYEFAAGYQQALRGRGGRVLLLDDDGRYQRYETDLVLNQNVSASETLYADRAVGAQLLLGARYALLRDQFRAWVPKSRPAEVAKVKVLVTLGGADPDNVTQIVIAAIQTLPANRLEATVVVGGSNPHRARLEAAVAAGMHQIRIVCDAKNMPELMEWADLAVSAAGSTTLELAYMGVPMLLLVLASNQQAVAEGMAVAGAARSLGWAPQDPAPIATALEVLIQDAPALQGLSQAGRRLVDGRGALRVVRALRGTAMTLRRVVAEDSRRLFDWANDSVVRSVSFRSEPIAWEDHAHWFAGKLEDPQAALFIAENEDHVPMGVTRFEIRGGVATISISIAAEFRGRGRGQELIELASERILERSDVVTVRALVKPDNKNSVAAFLAAGYQPDSAATTDEALVFIYPRSQR